MASNISDSNARSQPRSGSVLADAPRRFANHVTRFWPLWVAWILFGVAAAIGLETGVERLFNRWQFAYNHSFLVVLMAIWLLFVGLRGASLQRLAPSVTGLLLLLAVVALHAVSEVIDLTVGMQSTLQLVLLAGVFALMGRQMALYMLAPVGLLYFTIPVWDLTNTILQDISTLVVSAWVRWTGLTAIIEGYFIAIPAGRFEIAEGCSGMRYVLVGLALASFYAMCWLQRWRYRILLVAVAGVASMVANWVRIYTLILIGHWTDMQHYLIAVSHDEYGWVVFFVSMAPVLFFARSLEAREREPVSGRPGLPAVERRASAPLILLSGLLAAAIVASPAMLRGGEAVPSTAEPLELLEEPGPDWSGGAISYNWEPAFDRPHLAAHEAFISSAGERVEVYVARYLRQQPDAKLIARRNVLNPDWQRVNENHIAVSSAGEQRRVQRTELRSGGERRLTMNWYVVGGRTATQDLHAKLLEIPALFSGRRDGAVIALSASCSGNCESAEGLIRTFLEEHGEKLEAVADGRE